MDTLGLVINNNYFVGFVTVAGILFASLIRPPLPSGMVALFDSKWTKMVIYALIVLLLTRNLQVAIIVAVAFYVVMNLVSETKIHEGFMSGLQEEGFFDQQMEQFYDGSSEQNPPTEQEGYENTTEDQMATDHQ